jgi:hypothetical protein
MAKLKVKETKEIEGHRNPTKCEIAFGHGATHYKTFDTSVWLKKDGSLKQWIKCTIDGLRYYRL